MKQKNSHIPLLLSILLTLALLAFVFSTISFVDVLDLIRQSNRRWILAFLICSFTMSIFSTWRFRLLLQASGLQTPRLAMYLIVLVRNLFSDLLPARIGTLIYVYLVQTRLGIPIAPALSSFSYAFLFDLVAMAPLILFAAIFTLGSETFSPVAFFAIGFGLLIVLGSIAKYLPQIFHLLLQLLGSKLPTKLNQFLSKVSVELDAVANAKILGRVLTLSFGVRLCKYLGLYAFLIALLEPRGYTVSELPFSKVFLGMCAAETSSSLPISGIAGIGTYQGTWIAVFSLLGFPLDLAKLTSISHHLFTQGYGYSLGLIAFVLLLLPWFKRKQQVANYQTVQVAKMKSFIKILTFIVCSFLIAQSTLLAEKQDKVKYVQQKPAESSGNQRVIFDSNRSGTFGIYEVSRQGERKIVDESPAQEMFPDLSPSKDLLVYANAKGAGRYAESSIWMVKLDGSDSRLLAQDGTFPSFTADGRHVIFERDRKKVISIDLATKTEHEVFPVELASTWDNYEVVKPRISTDGKLLTFTSDKGGRWTIWLYSIEARQIKKISEGCQASFINPEELVLIRNQDVKAGAGIFKANLVSGTVQSLLDLDGPHGHEYFPRVFDNTLVFAATSASNHSHEDGGYQLFRYDLATKELLRINYDNATNRWGLTFLYPSN
ncbi:flippase-like domain-containing protein [bacterium]|nr:flippase-like domain-containing protein [bacterium]